MGRLGDVEHRLDVERGFADDAAVPEPEGDETVASTSAWRRVYLMARPRATRANAFALLLACLLGFAIATQVRQTQSQGLEDLRQDELVRILDVGSEDGLSFIAEDAVGDATTYTEAIGTDGLPAEEVRRITGEIATGVEAARARGLHHLALTPDIVLLTHDGRVKVRGLATSAALAGTETEGEEADRDDARAIVALAYAGLTGTWPLPGSTSLPAAPTSDGAPTPPSHLAVAVPGDLDTICRETLGDDTGPDSPGDYAAQIAPWSRIPLAGAVRTGSAMMVRMLVMPGPAAR